MNKIVITALICIIVAGGAGFFIGKNSTLAANSTYQMNGASGGNFQRGQGRFGGRIGKGVRGKVINSDNNSLTVQSNDGTSTIVITSGNTMYYKSAAAGKSDVNIGDNVMVFGQKNSDGSVTAQVVQLNPIGRQQSGSPTPAQ